MKVIPGDLPGLLKLQPVIHRDARGSSFESYNERDFAQATGLAARFVQDNHSHSAGNVLRGLHYQVQRPQGKLVRVLSGEIFDVVVDVRKSSPTRGRWSGTLLTPQDGLMLWIPPGYAHGFRVLSPAADVFYKTTDYWAPDLERAIAWNDADLAISWPGPAVPVLSARDARAAAFRVAELIE